MPVPLGEEGAKGARGWQPGGREAARCERLQERVIESRVERGDGAGECDVLVVLSSL